MTTQFDFSNDDWDHLATTPIVVGFAVARAEDSGFLGSHREMRTLLSTLASGGADNPARSLIDAATVAEPRQTLQQYSAANPEVLADTAVAACTRTVELLAATATAPESEGYRQWILAVATRVAEAARERGVRVSAPEAALIERLRGALQL